MSDRTIKEAISKLADTYDVDVVYYVNAVVDSVNIDNRTCSCTVTEGTTEYQLINVNLMASVDDGMLIEPVVGSDVRVTYTKTKESFIVQYSEIENIYITAKTKIIYNNGTNTTAKADILKTELDKTNSLLNALITIISGSPILEPGNGSPSAFQTALQISIASKQLGDYSEIENKSILHGE